MRGISFQALREGVARAAEVAKQHAPDLFKGMTFDDLMKAKDAVVKTFDFITGGSGKEEKPPKPSMEATDLDKDQTTLPPPPDAKDVAPLPEFEDDPVQVYDEVDFMKEAIGLEEDVESVPIPPPFHPQPEAEVHPPPPAVVLDDRSAALLAEIIALEREWAALSLPEADGEGSNQPRDSSFLSRHKYWLAAVLLMLLVAAYLLWRCRRDGGGGGGGGDGDGDDDDGGGDGGAGQHGDGEEEGAHGQEDEADANPAAAAHPPPPPPAAGLQVVLYGPAPALGNVVLRSEIAPAAAAAAAAVLPPLASVPSPAEARRILVAHRLPLRVDRNPSAPHGFGFGFSLDPNAPPLPLSGGLPQPLGALLSAPREVPS
ncbi:hypothetical protein ACP70R_018030 [Stipagrostis hirtigluma subsp. patula]